MKLKNVRTCNGCKALISDRCELNYEIIKHYDRRWGIYTDHKPLGKCPKPMNNKEYVNYSQKLRRMLNMTK